MTENKFYEAAKAYANRYMSPTEGVDFLQVIKDMLRLGYVKDE